MYFKYDDMISATNMMNSRPFFPSSDQFLCLSHPRGIEITKEIPKIFCGVF
jgi:hypothetical protein